MKYGFIINDEENRHGINYSSISKRTDSFINPGYPVQGRQNITLTDVTQRMVRTCQKTSPKGKYQEPNNTWFIQVYEDRLQALFKGYLRLCFANFQAEGLLFYNKSNLYAY